MAGKLWSVEEDDFLKQVIEAGGDMNDCLKVFPDRNSNSIRNRMTVLKLKFRHEVSQIDYDAFREVMKSLKSPVTI